MPIYSLLASNRFRQISWKIDIYASCNGDMVGPASIGVRSITSAIRERDGLQELQRNDVKKTLQAVHGSRNAKYFGFVVHPCVAFVCENDRSTFSCSDLLQC